MFAQKIFKGTIQSVILGLAIATTNLIAQHTSARRSIVSAKRHYVAPASNTILKRWAKYAALAFIAYRVYRKYQEHTRSGNQGTRLFHAPQRPQASSNTSNTQHNGSQTFQQDLQQPDAAITARQQTQARETRQQAEALEKAEGFMREAKEEIRNKQENITDLVTLIATAHQLLTGTFDKLEKRIAWIMLLYQRHLCRTKLENAYKNDSLLVASTLLRLPLFDPDSTKRLNAGNLKLSWYGDIVKLNINLSLKQSSKRSQEEIQFLEFYKKVTERNILSPFVQMANRENIETRADVTRAALARANGTPS